MWQLLCGLNYLYSAGVAHHEISPRNILLNATCDVCITDIPLYVEDEPDGHIAPLQHYYTSPEVLISGDEQAQPRQSMWTAGCILADILNNKMGSLYEGGYFQDIGSCSHFKKLVSVIGRPSDNELLSEDCFIKVCM
jgi:serine/threonine protein kinase